MKRILILISMLLVLTACSSKNNIISNKVAKAAVANNLNNTDKSMQTVVSSSDYAVSFDNLEQLVDKSEIIVEGEVIQTSCFDFNTVTYTKAKLKITKTFNSNVKVGDVITYVEPGGITTKAAIMGYIGSKTKFGEEPSEEDKKTQVRISIDGSENVKVGDKILIFGLQDYSVNVLPGEKYYVAFGAFQGKFNLNGENFERFAPKSLKTDKYLSLNKNKLQLEEDIEKVIKNKQKTN